VDAYSKVKTSEVIDLATNLSACSANDNKVMEKVQEIIG
jgi:hypothetical protein